MKESTLQVCFMMDCTASMGPWIDAAKDKLLELLDELTTEHTNFKIYAAFIGYRDFGEKSHRLRFTLNHETLHNMIMDIDAIGGGDEAEDVAGAYHWVSSLDWNADVRAIFHITDAPNHGTMYHDSTVSDDYPDGHPSIDLREDVSHLANKNVDLTVFRLNMTTDFMYNIMKDVYTSVRSNGFRTIDFMNSNQSPDTLLYRQISSQLHYSMSQHDDPTD